MKYRALVMIALWAGPALATPKKKPAPADPRKPAEPAPVEAPKPWANGVSTETQDKANALFDEANALFVERRHAPAVDKYRAALALWDHPMIRFNLAVTLIRLDRTLEAADELDRALRYDSLPFTPDLYQQALDYQALLKKQVGDLEASCDQTGTHLSLDGKPWFACPGKQKLRLLAGEHVLVGERDGYLTRSQRVVVTGGAVASRDVSLVSLDRAVKLEYPHRRWVPWTIAGAGAVVGLAGLGTYLLGRSELDSYYREYSALCPTGCKAPLSTQPSLVAEKSGAQLKGEIGAAVMIGGGAIALGGLVFVVVNRPRRVLPQVEVAPTGGGISASVGWRLP